MKKDTWQKGIRDKNIDSRLGRRSQGHALLLFTCLVSKKTIKLAISLEGTLSALGPMQKRARKGKENQTLLIKTQEEKEERLEATRTST